MALLKTNFGDEEDERCASRSAHWPVTPRLGRVVITTRGRAPAGSCSRAPTRLISGVAAVGAARSDQP